MRRRELLGAISCSLLGLSGCVGSGATPTRTEEQGSGTPFDRSGSGGTSSGSGSVGVEVTFKAVQPTVVELLTDRLSVSATDNQYLFVRVETDSEVDPVTEDFRLRFDGDDYTPVDRRSLYRSRTDRRYSESGDHGWLLYELPESGAADDTKLTWRDAEWAPPAAIRDRLATRPTSFSVTPSIPEEVPHGQRPTVSLTVENERNRPGQFVAGLNRSGPSVASIPVARISEPVQAGGKSELSIDDDAMLDDVAADERNDGEPDMRYELVWESGNADGKVRMTD